MTEPSRWQVEGATPEAKALIEEILTDDVMLGIETEAADEAARRALYGTAETPEQPDRMFVVSGRGHGKRAAAAAWAASPISQDFGPNPTPELAPGAWLADRDGAANWHPQPTADVMVSAGRHLARGHWMKRLFLRGRS